MDGRTAAAGDVFVVQMSPSRRMHAHPYSAV